MDREEIGVKDVNGRQILLGDIVEFYFCLFHGVQMGQFVNSQKCGSRMVDFVCRQETSSPIPGHTIKTYFAISPSSGGGIIAKRLEGACREVNCLLLARRGQ